MPLSVRVASIRPILLTQLAYVPRNELLYLYNPRTVFL